ncbi:MAG: hypothetical protein ACXWQR_14020 [Ktedonobacterales bacterium]
MSPDEPQGTRYRAATQKESRSIERDNAGWRRYDCSSSGSRTLKGRLGRADNYHNSILIFGSD